MTEEPGGEKFVTTMYRRHENLCAVAQVSHHIRHRQTACPRLGSNRLQGELRFFEIVFKLRVH